MKRIRIIGLSVVALLAFSAFAAASAYATPEFTNYTINGNKENFPAHFTSLGEKAKLTTKEHEIFCKTTLDLGFILPQPSVTSSMLGDIKFTFHGCELTGFGGGSCKSTGEPTGLISTPTYLWHLGTKVEVETKPGSGKKEKAVLILILTTETNFECESLAGVQKIKVEGNLVGRILEKDAKGNNQFNNARSTVEVEFIQEAKGVQLDRIFQFTLPFEEKKELDLKTSVNGGAFELSAEEASGLETLLAGTVELKA